MIWVGGQGAMPTAANDSETRAETALGALDCAHPEQLPSADGDYLAACSVDGLADKYLLGPSALSGAHISSAKSTAVDGRWQVDVTFDAIGAKDFAALTASMAANSGQLAITVGATVESAPLVQSPITDGRIQISGQFDQGEAAALAAAFTAGAQH
ncbi:hypothetical protein ACFQ9X_26365 [Catenulispora yoronensis]